MLRSIITSPSKTIASAAFLISATTLVSRIVGILRDRAFAHYFGVGQVMDAYYAAFKIPDFIYNLLIVGALSTGFIPIFTSLFFKSDDKQPAWKLANSILNIAGISLSCASILGIVCAPWISRAVGPGFDPYTLELATRFTRIIFISPVLLGISMVLGGILQSLRYFLSYSLAPILYNVGIIIGVVILVPLIGVTGIAWGVVLGAFLHTITQWHAVHLAGFRWKKVFSLRDKNVRTIGSLMIPRTLGLALTQLNAVAMSIIASTLGTGSVGVFNLANNIQGVPIGIIGVPFALAVFPLLSEAVAKKTDGHFRTLVSATLRNVIFLLIPISILFLMLRAQIIRVLYGTGAFDWNATITTANTVAFFSLGLLAQSLIPLLARAFYALSETRTPFLVSIFSEACTLAAALLFTQPRFGVALHVPTLMNVAGLACAASIGATINALILYFLLRRKMLGLHDQELFVLLLKTGAAGAGMAIAIQLCKYPVALLVDMDRWWGILLHGFISGIVGLLIYAALAALLRVPELSAILEGLKRRFLKKKMVPGAIDDGSTP